jgi:predicted nucleotidyltransferase
MMPMRPDVDQLALPESLSPQDRDHIRQASRYLREQGAARVWLFGSLARGRLPTVHSDFDFAVEGLPPTRHFGCLGHLLQVLPRPVDLVDMACCPPFLHQRILEEGILLTE